MARPPQKTERRTAGIRRAPPWACRPVIKLPVCAVHPVPVKLRRLVEGISSGPGDSREHDREHLWDWVVFLRVRDFVGFC
jgi:hypothetical protein